MWNVFRLFGVLDQEFQHFMRKRKNDIFGRILDVQKSFIKISKSLWAKFRGAQGHDFSISCSDFSVPSFEGPLTWLATTFNHFGAKWTSRKGLESEKMILSKQNFCHWVEPYSIFYAPGFLARSSLGK